MQSVLSKGSLLLLLYIETSDERERGGRGDWGQKMEPRALRTPRKYPKTGLPAPLQIFTSKPFQMR